MLHSLFWLPSLKIKVKLCGSGFEALRCCLSTCIQLWLNESSLPAAFLIHPIKLHRDPRKTLFLCVGI